MSAPTSSQPGTRPPVVAADLPEPVAATPWFERAKRFSAPLFFLIAGVIWIQLASNSSYRQDELLLVAQYSLLALGMYISLSMGNQLSIAYGAYLSIGAYTLGIISVDTSLPLIVAIPLAMVVAATVAFLLGLVTIRLAGLYLAAATLLFAYAFDAWAGRTSITHGELGIGGIRQFSFFGTSISRLTLVVCALAVVWLIAVAIGRLRRSSFGLALLAQRETPVAVNAAGASTRSLNLIALATGAAVAALGGIVFAASSGSIYPGAITTDTVILAIFMPLLGGQSTPWGAVVGAVITAQVTLWASAHGLNGPLIFSAAVILVLIFLPGGILGTASSLWRMLTKAWSARRGATSD